MADRLMRLPAAAGLDPTLPVPERLLKLSEVCAIVSLARTTIYRRMDDGSFPPPVRLGTAVVRWKLSDIERWIADLPATRSA